MHSSRTACGTYLAGSWPACPRHRSDTVSSKVGPFPDLARSTASWAASYTSRTSWASTRTPGMLYAPPRSAIEPTGNSMVFGVEYAHRLLLTTHTTRRLYASAAPQATGYEMGRWEITVNVCAPSQSPMWLLPSRPRV